MVGQRLNALVGEVSRQVLGVLAREAIDDGRSVGMLPKKIEQSLEGPTLGADEIGQIPAVKAGDELARSWNGQLPHDVVANLGGGRGREGHDGRVGKALAQDVQVAVVRAEVVAPFGDAVSFVNRDQADVGRPEKLTESGNGQSLRRDVEDLQST